ncbi:MAPEG family protein [Rhizobium sp. KVB221]|uniref:MAPEG family protein n=1 Tax=Rhizobium setariae TaxID=2801340 RepID=A0A937CMA1_9HYPH|nr:MAPEG family protein [Rhizobium setariae]MBL0374075.1 MAPEG family protein [Rhizobium setariae]
MSTELLCLVWSTVLGGIYICTQVATLYAERGVRNYDPNRDKQHASGLYTGRGERAVRNFLETYPFFVALVLATEMSSSGDVYTTLGAIVYLVARVIYLPFYIGGLGPLRSIAWAIAMAGLAIMFFGVLF